MNEIFNIKINYFFFQNFKLVIMYNIYIIIFFIELIILYLKFQLILNKINNFLRF